MQKILELNNKEWLTGITEEINNSKSSILSVNTRGVSASDFDANLAKYGILGVGSKPFEVKYSLSGTWTTVDDIHGVSSLQNRDDVYGLSEAPLRYLYSTTGNIYYINLFFSDKNPVDVRTGDPLADAAAGLGSIVMQDGTRYLLYARDGHIGRHDVSTSVFDDTWHALSSSTNQRPMYRFQDRVYFGNENKVGMIFEESGSLSVNDNALDLPPTESIIDFTGIDKYLVIATDSGEVFFWNTNTDSWQRRVTVQKEFQNLYSLFELSGRVYVLMDSGIWSLGFSEPPRKEYSFSSNSDLRPQHTGVQYFTSFGPAFASSNKNKISYITKNNSLAIFSAQENKINLSHTGIPESSTFPKNSLVLSFNERGAYVSVWNEGLFVFSSETYDPDSTTSANEEDARQAQSGVTQAETRIIDMNDTYQVNMIEVLLDQAPQTHTDYENDKLVVKARGNTNDTYTTFGTIDTTGELKKTFQLRPTQTFEDDTIQIKLEFEGGNPLVRSVKVYGDKISQ